METHCEKVAVMKLNNCICVFFQLCKNYTTATYACAAQTCNKKSAPTKNAILSKLHFFSKHNIKRQFLLDVKIFETSLQIWLIRRPQK